MREFGPLALKALRVKMVAKQWARGTVNDHCGRVKRIVRWAVENELVPADRWEALRAVAGLASGRTTARDPEPIEPVDEKHYQAALPHVRPQVRMLLELLALTGMRPAEGCRIRPHEIDMTGDVWVYKPSYHKTKHKGKARTIPLGKRARELLKAITPENPDDFYFSPLRAEAQRLVEARAKQKTKVQPSQVNRKKVNLARKPGRAYKPHGIEVAVRRACEAASPPPAPLAGAKTKRLKRGGRG